MDLDDILKFDRLYCTGDRAIQGWYLDQNAILEAMDKLGIERRVAIRLQTGKWQKGRHRIARKDGSHKITIPRNTSFAHATYTIWHELAHCMQAERWVNENPNRNIHSWHWDDYKAVDGEWGETYRGNLYEKEANRIAEENADFHLVVFGT